MSDTVRQRGIDSSGRAILASDLLWDCWESVVAELGFRPVITQGSWMSRVPGGGAENSEGYHDKGGPFDLRVWDRTPAERLEMVRVLRLHGCAAYRRYKSQGMDEDHLHFVCGADHDLSPGAAAQWRAYIDGRDGLAGNGPDYEWRPTPLVLTPPEDDVTPEDIEAIAKRTAELILDDAKVDKDKKVSVRQALNQTRNDAAKAASK